MQHRSLLSALVATILACGPAAAQVTFDPRALNQLNKPATPAPTAPSANAPAQAPTSDKPATPARRGQVEPSPRRPTPPARPADRTPAKPATTPAPRPGPAVPPAKPSTGHPANGRTAPLPTTPPANPAIPPPIVVPARPVPPPTPVPVVPSAQGVVSPIAGGRRITFGVGTADLNPATDAALRTMVHAAPPFNTTTFTVMSYAAGSDEDPSTSRRLSLARALAVRSVLIAEGVASVRIYVKALGTSAPTMADGPPDRVDILVATPQGTTPTASPAPAPVVPAPAPTVAPPPPAKAR